MKITPIHLVSSWNALNDVIDANDDPALNAQADRLKMQVRNEVIFWNELSVEKRTAIKDKPMTVSFDPIGTSPAYYPNDRLEDLNRFFKPALKPQSAAMQGLIDKTNNKKQD